MIVCIAGKNDIAVKVLRRLVAYQGVAFEICVVVNSDDRGENTWQESLKFTALDLGIKVLTLDDLYDLDDLLFISVEFDKIIRPSNFNSDCLYNIHFSALPRHRGTSTAVWPILEGDTKAGVTFHEINAGIDTGDIVDQRLFELPADYTARDLYFKLMEEGENLVIDNVTAILESNSKPQALAQDNDLASCHYRKDIDFSNISQFIDYSSIGVSRYLRAFHFYEYQLPEISGIKIYRYKIKDCRSTSAPATLTQVDLHTYCLSTIDYDIELKIDPYEHLYSYCSGNTNLPSGFDWREIDDINRLNKSGWSLLMVASYNGNIDAVKKLIRHGADVNVRNKRGTSALMYSRSCSDMESAKSCFELLLSQGANSTTKDVRHRDIASYMQEDRQYDLIQLLEMHNAKKVANHKSN
jgi:methionyl-tRNA formyltransferase